MSVEILALAAAVVGAAWGIGADRLAARWPEHEPEAATPDHEAAATDHEPAATATSDTPAPSATPGTPRRAIDWRTIVVAGASAAVFAALVLRYPDPRDLLLLGACSAALVVLLATDLDQKLLPDALTLPLIALAGVALFAGWSPLLAGDNAILNGLAAGIGAPVILFLLDFLLKGALGLGDLKLAVSIGFLAGISRFFTGFVIASAASSFVLLALIATRRISMRTAIPFGPVLIGAAFVAMLLP